MKIQQLFIHFGGAKKKFSCPLFSKCITRSKQQKNWFLVFSFSFWFQFIQRIEHCRPIFCPEVAYLEVTLGLKAITNWHNIFKNARSQQILNAYESAAVSIYQSKTIGFLLTKLFWPTVRKNCSSDREKLLKFEAEGQDFAKFLRSQEQFIQTVKVQNNFW